MIDRLRILAAVTALAGFSAVSATPAHAVAVTAADFFAACPGPIFVTQNTEMTGAADIFGDCVVSVDPGFSSAWIASRSP